MLSALVGALGPAAAALAGHADPDTASLLRRVLDATDATNAVVTQAESPDSTSSNAALRDSDQVLATANLLAKPEIVSPVDLLGTATNWEEQLDIARTQRKQRRYDEAAPTLIAVVLANSSDHLKRTALLELAVLEQERNNLSRAQQILAHYLAKWPDDENTPEVILRQGLILRQMGLSNLALTKFYSVMTSSLVLRADKLKYYQRLVLQAQTEIADTYFQQGNFQDSAEMFGRLLKQDSPLLNKPQVHFKLIRSLSNLGRFEEAARQAKDFLCHYESTAEQAEVRFHFAVALKQLGRNDESLIQVLHLLREQQPQATTQPEVWNYWRQKAGNEIANRLYQDADYLNALQVYLTLASLNTNAEWQLQVWYQIGLTYERLEQPAKALEQYSQIVNRRKDLATNSTPVLDTIFDLARWRQQYISWQTNAEMVLREFNLPRIPTED